MPRKSNGRGLLEKTVGNVLLTNFRALYGNISDAEIATFAGMAGRSAVTNWKEGAEPGLAAAIRLAVRARRLVDDLLRGADSDYDVLSVQLRASDPGGRIMGDEQIDTVVRLMLQMDKESKHAAMRAVAAVLAGGAAGPQSGGEGQSPTGTHS